MHNLAKLFDVLMCDDLKKFQQYIDDYKPDMSLMLKLAARFGSYNIFNNIYPTCDIGSINVSMLLILIINSKNMNLFTWCLCNIDTDHTVLLDYCEKRNLVKVQKLITTCVI